MENDLISRSALLENIKRVYCADCNSYNGVRCRACGTGDALDMIEDAPAVDALALPCKIGDTVWMIITKRPKLSMPEEFSFIKKSRLTWNNLNRILQDFGKTVFLTHQEAEAALSLMERKEGAE